MSLKKDGEMQGERSWSELKEKGTKWNTITIASLGVFFVIYLILLILRGVNYGEM